MIKHTSYHAPNFRIRYRYTDSGSIRTGSAYFKTAESAEKFLFRLHEMHPDATIF